MADDSDKIRQKRLAKLANGAASPRPEGRTVDAASQIAAKSTPMTPSDALHDSNSPQGVSQDDHDKSRVRSRPQKTPRTDEDDQAGWEDRQIRSLLRITLDPQKTTDNHGKALLYLTGLHADLLADETVPRMTTAHLDQAMTEIGSLVAEAGRDIFDFLLACWKRVAKAHRAARSSVPRPPAGSEEPTLDKVAVLAETRRICMSYCLFAITFPEMFTDRPQQHEKPLLKYLTSEPDQDLALDYDFLAEASSRLNDDDSVKNVLVSVACQISQRLATMSMLDDYRPYLTAFHNLIRHSKLVHAISESPDFLPACSVGVDVELRSILGPLFRLSPTQTAMAVNDFSAPRSRDRGSIATTQTAVQMLLQRHHQELFDITNTIVRSGKEPRERLLDWFALTVNLNHNRRAIQPDSKNNSTDGFMINVTAILDMLCSPFLDENHSKIDKVDIDYLRRSPRVSVADETKINADQRESDAFYAQSASGTNGFTTELFFLTVAAHHYGLEAANTQLESLQKHTRQMEREIPRFEAQRARLPIGSPHLVRFDREIKIYTDKLDKLLSGMHATQGVLLEPNMQKASMQLMSFLIVWLLRLTSGQEVHGQNIKLPLAGQQPDVFKCLPEYFVEDLVDNFKFITRHLPNVITTRQSEELVALCVTFLTNSEYVKSPYLKAGLVSILCYGIWPSGYSRKGVLEDVLGNSSFCHQHLLHALMKFYIEVESTGTSTQFYDKFNIRYEIDTIIKRIWPNPIYRDKLAKEASLNKDFFVHFVNMLLNDVTYVVDESFTAFQKIHSLDEELKAAVSMDADVRKEKEDLLADQKGKAKSYMGLTTETISMLKLFTDALAASFAMPEVVQRLADMLDYNLDTLTGPKRSSLRVQNPEEYGFNPRQLLSDIVDVYLNLRNEDRFCLAVARDGRSYTPDRFNKAVSLVIGKTTKSAHELQAFQDLANKIAKVYAAEQQAIEDMGEIPEGLEDPLMGSLMEDPVILPSSRNIVDRSTIRSHLLSDATDPFNRVPLKIEDVIPAVDKKREIEEFLASRRVERMDMS